MIKNKNYLTIQQLAKRLGMPVSAIKKHCQNGALRFQQRSKNSYNLFVFKSAEKDIHLVNRLQSMGINFRRVKAGKSMSIVSRKVLEKALLKFDNRRQNAKKRLKINNLNQVAS